MRDPASMSSADLAAESAALTSEFYAGRYASEDVACEAGRRLAAVDMELVRRRVPATSKQ